MSSLDISEKKEKEERKVAPRAGGKREEVAPLSDKEVCRPKMPGKFGANQAFDLVTNSFTVQLKPKSVYMYLVEFDPEIPPDCVTERRITLRRYFKKQLAEIGLDDPPFDGMSLYSIKMLPQKAMKFTRDEKTIIVSLSPTHLLQASLVFVCTRVSEL